MDKTKALITTAAFALSAAGLIASGSTMAADEKQEMEKCYGVAKAGKNDCQTSSSACAGTSKQDRQKSAYIALPKGTCSKIAGGSLTPG